MAHPGSINYVEGQASVDGQPLNSDSPGQAELGAGQTLTTGNGRVEVLLTPGVFLRVDNNSSVRMVSPDLANTEVELDRGRAMVEATDIHKENNIRVDENGASAKILKNGLYDFDFAHNQIRTYKGKLQVNEADRKVDVGDDREVTLNAGTKLSAHDFNDKQTEDDFYRWSGLRSGYLAEANVDAARTYVNGGGWYGPGWYWDPWYASYTFIPGGNGIYYSPFGWGFYSPFAVWGSPFYYYGGVGVYHRFGDYHGPYGHGFVPQGGFHRPVGPTAGFRGGISRGFHGIGGMARGGGGRR
jgi:hypothetical protein